MNVFEFECYREYLKYIIHVKMNKRGSHAKLSRAMKCQPSYLTQVLNFRVNLTKDQVYALSVFLRLDTRETLYLLNLLEMEKAGNSEYKKFLSEQNLKLRSRIEI